MSFNYGLEEKIKINEKIFKMYVYYLSINALLDCIHFNIFFFNLFVEALVIWKKFCIMLGLLFFRKLLK